MINKVRIIADASLVEYNLLCEAYLCSSIKCCTCGIPKKRDYIRRYTPQDEA